MSETQEQTQTGTHSLHIRIPMEVYTQIKAQAAQNYTSINKVILALVLEKYGDAE